MITFRVRSRALLALVAASLFAGPAVLAASPRPAEAACTWVVTPSPNGVTDGNRLWAVAADSSTDAWAVGTYPGTSAQQALTAHWNGKTWSLVPAAHHGPYDNGFSGVAADSPDDAWAVGYFWDGSANLPLIEHWNGKAWAVASTPKISSVYGATLNAVTIVAPNNVWAVGSIQTSSGQNQAAPNALTLIEHWNGVNWSIVSSPNKNTIEDVLTGVTFNNENDVWAAGIYAPNTPGFDQNLAEHWNGKTWAIVPTPDATTNTSNNFNAVGAVSTTSVFASGDYYNASAGVFRTLTAHWNGQAWTLLASANAGNVFTVLAGVAAVSPTEVVSVGSYVSGSLHHTYAMVWDGKSAVGLATPNVYATGSYFDAASRIPGTSDIWAAGGTLNSDNSPHQSLIELYHC
jgi:hypothetical protein